MGTTDKRRHRLRRLAVLGTGVVTGIAATSIGLDTAAVRPATAATARATATAAVMTTAAIANEASPASAGTDPFDGPSGLVGSGGGLWVTNDGNNTLTEVRPPAGGVGTVMRVVRAAADGLDRPDAVVAGSGDLWVANRAGSVGTGGSVTELRSSDGSLVRRVTGSSFHFDQPVAERLDGSTLVVLDMGRPTAHPAVAGSLTEIDSASGRLRRTISGSDLRLDDPVAIAASGADAWVADEGSNTVTEIDVATGALVRTVTGKGLAGPAGIAVAGGSVWVADRTSSALTQIDAATGVVEATWTDGDASYGFNHPTVVRAYGSAVYVTTPDGTSPMVTRIPTADPSAPSWYMCNTNGPYYFSELSGLAIFDGHLVAASASGANWQGADPAEAATGSLTALDPTTGALLGTMP